MAAASVTDGDVIALFRTLASSARPTGSQAESGARVHCRAWLERGGFDISEVPFSYSAWPGLYATPILGALLMTVCLLSVLALGKGGSIVDPVMTWASVAVATIAGTGMLIGRFGTSRLPWMRRTSTILQAKRGEPAVWLMAHLDSKSQPVSLLARAGGAVAFALGWIGSLATWMMVDASGARTGWLLFALAVSLLACAPLILSWIGSKGDGALDNASGVAAVLAAALTWPADRPLGVVITSGEELGLAGARAWVAGRPTGFAINCDGVDDGGSVTVTLGRGLRGGLGWHRREVERACGPGVRVRRILPGVLLDAVALTDAGWAACTVSKGSLRSLARIHTRRDTLAEMGGMGIPETARRIVALGGAIIA